MVIILYLWYIQNGAPKLLLMAQPLKHPQSESVSNWKLIKTNNSYFLLTFRSLSETFIRRTGTRLFIRRRSLSETFIRRTGTIWWRSLDRDWNVNKSQNCMCFDEFLIWIDSPNNNCTSCTSVEQSAYHTDFAVITANVQAAAQDIPVRAVVFVTSLLHCLRHDFLRF